MGHKISALITRQDVNAEKAKEFDLAIIEQNQNVKIIPLDAGHSDFWAEKLDLFDIDDNSEIIMDCKTTHFFAAKLGLTKFAVIETDYHGGIGSQIACVYEEGKLILEHKEGQEGPINEALRLIGVFRKDNMDEFDTISLGMYRHFEEPFLKYYEH